MILFNLVLIIFLLFLNGFFVAAEFAFVGVRKTRIQQLSDEGNFDAKLALDAVKNIDKYIAAVQLGITIASLGLGWVGESTIAVLIHPIFSFLPSKLDAAATHTVSVTVAFVLITVFHVVIGELMPKSIALQFPEKTSLWVAKPMFVIAKIFAPMIYVLNGLGNFLLKICGIEPANSRHLVHTTEELNMLIDASYRGGVLNKKEAEILQNVFKFSDLTVSQVMIPRTDMVCIPINASPEEINNIIIHNENIKTNIIVFNYKGINAHTLAEYLNKNKICIRAGNHCAKMIKEVLNVKDTCRISLYFYNTKEEIDYLIEILKSVN